MEMALSFRPLGPEFVHGSTGRRGSHGTIIDVHAQDAMASHHEHAKANVTYVCRAARHNCRGLACLILSIFHVVCGDYNNSPPSVQLMTRQ
jgi:hypothetical protein